MAEEKKLPTVKRVSAKTRPVEVRVGSKSQTYFVKIWQNGSLEIRPKGARKAESIALTTVDSTYQRALLVRARDAKPTRKRRNVKRGLLSTERGGF